MRNLKKQRNNIEREGELQKEGGKRQEGREKTAWVKERAGEKTIGRIMSSIPTSYNSCF